MALGCHPGIRELVAGTHLWRSPRISICAERADSAVLDQLGFRGTIQLTNTPQCATRPKYVDSGLRSMTNAVGCIMGRLFPHRTGLRQGHRRHIAVPGLLGMRRRFARSTMYFVVQKNWGATCADTTMVSGNYS